MGVLDIIVRLLDQFEIIALPVGMLLGVVEWKTFFCATQKNLLHFWLS
jgi:hypothetical protein